MYEYKFVKVELSKLNRKPKENYQDIITNHAKEGWRLVQIFAPATSGYGAASHFEIIFERPF
ncbi:DUF4177 domain-containing protein [Bacillus sp. WMMC1349]|uniref:DUF4177 domain-containing protein n=1 Tax=Bacillus sp. WMMC1349 TaxID=2736254 RepID=UPI001554DC06|nr:DUF4177 domain-containing protein [Bacillus sp. WMMC1349]NPC93590.1 DUF4177 domain-containing protein [Bacillus sp. WMMC1349]